MDEMYIREDLVYEKHSGRMIGYSHLGDVNSQLTEFEKDVHCRASSEQGRALAKTIVVIMVRGLFTKLQFPYTQFPCSHLTKDQLYELFWEAVGRIENCGLKVHNLHFYRTERKQIILSL